MALQALEAAKTRYQQQLEHLAVKAVVHRWLSLSEASRLSSLSTFELGYRVGAHYRTEQENNA